MRTIVATTDGVIELNYLWLPTVIGMNSSLKRDMEKALKCSLEGLTLDEAGLDRVDAMAREYLIHKFPSIVGLDKYLDALKYLEPL